MKLKLTLISAIGLAGVLPWLQAQQVPEGLPWPRGVYIRAGNDWVSLPVNPLMPFREGSARQLLGLGESDAVAEMPGPHALVQIGNAKPTFYVRGIPATYGIVLVRSEQRDDYRKVRMQRSRDFRQFAKFRSRDLVDFDIRPISGDVLTITPRTDLAPGEYAIVSTFEQNIRQIRAGFEFGVTGR